MLSQWLKELNTAIQCLGIKPKAIKIHAPISRFTICSYMTHFVGYITRKPQSKLHARRCRKTKLLLLRKIIVPYQRESLALVAYVKLRIFLVIYSQVIAQENGLAAFSIKAHRIYYVTGQSNDEVPSF